MKTAQAQAPGRPCGISCGQIGIRVNFHRVYWVFSADYTSPHSLTNLQGLSQKPIYSCGARYSTSSHTKNKKRKTSAHAMYVFENCIHRKVTNTAQIAAY
jgi:hypothetical protein